MKISSVELHLDGKGVKYTVAGGRYDDASKGWNGKHFERRRLRLRDFKRYFLCSKRPMEVAICLR